MLGFRAKQAVKAGMFFNMEWRLFFLSLLYFETAGNSILSGNLFQRSVVFF